MDTCLKIMNRREKTPTSYMIKELGIRVHGMQCRQAIVTIELPKRPQTCISILVGRTKQAPAYKARSPCWKRNFKFFFSPAGTEKKSLFLRFLQIGDINKSHSSECGNACTEWEPRHQGHRQESPVQDCFFLSPQLRASQASLLAKQVSSQAAA